MTNLRRRRPYPVTIMTVSAAAILAASTLAGCEVTEESSNAKLEALSLQQDIAKEAGRQAEERRKESGGGSEGGGGGHAH